MSTILALFGVFYLSLAGVLILQLLSLVITRIRSILIRLDLAMICFLLLWTMWYVVGVMQKELVVVQELSTRTLASFDQKIEYEHQYYSTYLLAFKPVIESYSNSFPIVRLIDLPVREYLFARGYLYPYGVQESGLVSVEEGDLVIGTRSLIKDQKWPVLTAIHDRTLGVANENVESKGKEK